MVASREGTRVGRAVRAAALAALVLLAACAAPRPPYSAPEAAVATVDGPLTRTRGDIPSAAFTAKLSDIIARAKRQGETPTYLTMSGGGGNGAFGAGLLAGWTASGRRPTFTVVSGVSTGALLAPFAYLGPAYDGELRELYTSGVAGTIIPTPNPVRALLGDSFVSSDAFKALIARYVTPELIAAVAREYAQGRVLMIVTTDLDTERPTLWNMGEIAAQGTPASADLFRSVLLASASIPAVFPPVFIPARAEGRTVQEMHVDGSVSGNIFTLSRQGLLTGLDTVHARGTRLYILMNSPPVPSFEVTRDSIGGIVGRAVSTAVQTQEQDDLELAYLRSRTLGLDYNLIYPHTADLTSDQFGLDTAYMRGLYARGQAVGQTGTFWMKTPGLD